MSMSQERLLKKFFKSEDITKIDIFKQGEDILEAMKLRPEVVSERWLSLIERKVLSKFNLSRITLAILYIIDILGEVSQSMILKYVYTSAPNLSQRIEWLLREGLIVQKTSRITNDRRKKKFKITSRGRKKLKAASKAVAEFKQKLTKYFTKREIAQVWRFYMRLSKVLDKMEEE
jgi:DNA-binding MarR family transcriptional regulator